MVAFPLSRENLRIEVCPRAWAYYRDANQEKIPAKQNCAVPEAVNAGFLLVNTLSMMITPQLTACWGSTALEDGMGREVIGLTPALQATCYLLRCCFLARPATAREMQQAQKCTLGCTPSTP